MWLGTISLKQVDNLKQIFAKFDGEDWVIPDWLCFLEYEVIKRDYRQNR